jgi:hypothetical protein
MNTSDGASLLLLSLLVTGSPPASAQRAAPAPQAPVIDHRPVACAVAERFPRMEARFTPADSIATARVLFQGATANEWYSVAMTPEASGFSGILPKPKKSLKEFHYYLEVTDRALRSNRTIEYTTAVVGGAGECQGKVLAATVASAVITLTGPAGAAVVPAGFAAGGVVAAGSAGVAGASGAGTGGGGLSTGVLVAGGAVVAGAGIAVAAGSGKSSDTTSASTAPTAASCPTAAQFAATTGGALVAVGSAACTQFVPCTTGGVRVCVQNWCSTSTCSIYYETSGGSQTVCSTGCSTTDTSGIQACATTAVSKVCQ